VLDAGCGGEYLYADFHDAHIVGIDLDADALARNTRINEKVLGDILTYPFEAETFDAVVCQDVLEHLSDPTKALQNFARWVKPGGKIILGFPNVMTAKGLITKFTPHAFHLWFYRRILGSEKAGTPGYGPYKTYLRFAISPRGIRRRAKRLGLEVERFKLSEGGFQARSRVIGRLLGPLQRRTECQVVLRKPDPRESEHAYRNPTGKG
jgi:SAM-dependent methyltransferase